MKLFESRKSFVPIPLVTLLAAALLVLLDSRALMARVRPAAAYADSGSLKETLLAEGEKHQAIRLNPNAALQKHIFADGAAPNSPEMEIEANGVPYVVQRAVSIDSGRELVFFVQKGDWSNVRVFDSGKVGGEPFLGALWRGVEKHRVIYINPFELRQNRILRDGLVPNCQEFKVEFGGLTYWAQRAEVLDTGLVRVYYVLQGDWEKIMFVERDALAGS